MSLQQKVQTCRQQFEIYISVWHFNGITIQLPLRRQFQNLPYLSAILVGGSVGVELLIYFWHHVLTDAFAFN